MSNAIEIGDPLLARQFLLQSWGLARADKLTAHSLGHALRIAFELANDGQPVMPLGFISDVTHGLASVELTDVGAGKEIWSAPTVDASLIRRYEDYVLGKLAADLSLERAADELHRYKGRDLDRAQAYVLQQINQRCQLPCVHIGPATIKSLLAMNSNALQQEFETALKSGFNSSTCQPWDDMIQAVRNCGELLGVEDIFELASGTALSRFGQRLALRQVMQALQHLVLGLPKQRPSGARRHYAVATNIHEEDLYPVGGFSSIANRGTIESLLRSELAYMETDERPDLFDIKYARDELLYYARDENQFFRRRVTILLVLDPSLVVARVKDSGQSWQRIVLTMAVVVALVKTLTDWLSSDALKFELLFLSKATELELRDEWTVLELIFRDEIHAGWLELVKLDQQQLRLRSEEHARQSMCHLVRIAAGTKATAKTSEGQDTRVTASVWQPLITQLNVENALPVVSYDDEHIVFEDSHDPWREALHALLASVNC